MDSDGASRLRSGSRPPEILPHLDRTESHQKLCHSQRPLPSPQTSSGNSESRKKMQFPKSSGGIRPVNPFPWDGKGIDDRILGQYPDQKTGISVELIVLDPFRHDLFVLCEDSGHQDENAAVSLHLQIPERLSQNPDMPGLIERLGDRDNGCISSRLQKEKRNGNTMVYSMDS